MHFHLQVVHHIFPGINQYYYPQIAPIVKQACKEFGVPFNVKVGRLKLRVCSRPSR